MTVVECKLNPGDWRVESFGPDGECYIAIFTGSMPRRRAEEYVTLKERLIHECPGDGVGEKTPIEVRDGEWAVLEQ